MAGNDASDLLLSLTAEIVSAHVANNRVDVGDLPALIQNVHSALTKLVKPNEAAGAEVQRPAVPVRLSIRPDHLVCLEDGKHLTMLKRYLMRTYGMTPGDYRAKWKLPADYPMVAPSYAERRRELANSIGLGRKREMPVAAPEPPLRQPAAVRRNRRPEADDDLD